MSYRRMGIFGRRMLGSLLFAAVVLALPGGIAGAEVGDPAEGEISILRVRLDDRARQMPILAGMGLDLAGMNTKNGTVDFVGGRSVVQALEAAGFDPQVVRPVGAGLAEALADYLDPAEVATRLENYQAAFPSLARKIQIATTTEVRAVWAMKISDNVGMEEDEPTVFFDCQHHAREVMTPEICLDIVDYLLTRYTTDPQVQGWVDAHEIWVIGTVNPDGTNTVFTSNTAWRKNRRNNGDGSFGVDLNRNYPFGWGSCGGSSSTPSAEDYRGPSAASEPETAGYNALARAHRPALAVSYHSYGELVLHPYGCNGIFSPENRLARDLSSDLAVRLRNDANTGWYDYGTSWELLNPVDGGMRDWFYGELGASAWTIEVSGDAQGFQPDYATWRNSTVLRHRPAWQYLIDRLDGPSIWGHVTDACTGAPLVATVALDEVTFVRGEIPRLTEPDHGRFHWLTLPGTWHLRASKTGYAGQVLQVDVGARRTTQDVRLVPTGSAAVAIASRAILDAAGDGDGEADPGETIPLRLTAAATGGGLSGLTATLTTSDPYVTVTDPIASWPSIAAGGSGAALDTFSFDLSLATPDEHVVLFTVTFGADQALCSPAVTLPLRVTRGAASCPAHDEPFDSNPGWTIQNSGTGGWAFGPPTGTGGTGGPPTPRSGSNVFATNLAGSYGNNGDFKLTSLPIDLSLLRGTELRFWRWLNNEVGGDVASIEISTDGTTFTEVWSGFGRDTQWNLYRVDLSAVADGQPAVYVRFRLRSDSSTAGSGFYIDDFSICGETVAPAPTIVVTGWSLDDGVKTTCTDGDAYPDAGEVADLTVAIENRGNALAAGTTARLSTSDSHVTLVRGLAELGALAPGGTTSATFRIHVTGSPSCLEEANFFVDFEANAGAYAARDASVVGRLQTDDGISVPDTIDTFETTTLWTLTGEWQIQRPRGKGGAGTVDGFGGPDPFAAYGGIRALGVDLTGTGTSLGNYENNLANPIVATSPLYDCTNARNVRLQFKRWLGVESSLYDHATIEAWDGSNWQVVWSNPTEDLSETSWQSVDYDISRWADGNPALQVRFRMTSNNARVFCGWNIDDLTVTNGFTPQECESGACAPPCTPTTQTQGVTLSHANGVTTIVWPTTGDPCQETAGIGSRVYRAPDPRPRIATPAAWPADSFFIDITSQDGDGDLGNLAFVEYGTPQPGAAFFYLVVPVGASGAEGPRGWQGF